MTRNADEAIDEQQLALSRKCDAMLASSAWNSANVRTYKGMCSRLKQFSQNGLPSMRVISHKALEELGRIPRSNEGFQEDALAAVERCGTDSTGLGDALAVIIFYSHRWLRPDWCEAMGREVKWGSPQRKEAMERNYHVGDPDDADHSKAKALIAWGKWFHGQSVWSNDIQHYFRTTVPIDNAGENRFKNNIELFYWIDWACTDQNAPGPDMAALPAYVGACTLMLAGWNKVYERRAWCQVELLMGFAFMSAGNRVLVLPEGFRDTNQRGLAAREVELPDPCDGDLSNPDDKKVITSLRTVAERSTSFSFGRLCAHECGCSRGLLWWIGTNVVCCCQMCGLLTSREVRSVRPGTSRLTLLTPSAQETMV